MAWTTPRTWVAGETPTAAIFNAHVRDNFNATGVSKVTTAGDLTYATGANALTRLAVGTTDYILKSSGSAPTWAAHYDHAAAHSDSGSDPLTAGGVTSSMVAGDFIDDLVIFGYNEVASASVTTTEATVASFTVAIPAGWTTWRCWATATFGYNTYGVGSFHGIMRIDGTNTQDQNVDTPSDFVASGAVTAHRTGMTTTGTRTIAFRVYHGGASGTGVITDINLVGQAYRVN